MKNIKLTIRLSVILAIITLSEMPLLAQITSVTNFNGCTGSQAFLDVQVSNPELSSNYHWDFGDSTSQNIAYPTKPGTSHIYANAGIYHPTFTVTYSSGVAYSAILSVLQNPLPIFDASIAVVDSIPAAFILIHQSDSSKVDICQYNVDFGDDYTVSYISHSSNLPFVIEHNYSKYGKYEVTINAIATASGCENSVIKPVIITPPPIPYFDVSNLCQGNSTYFYGSTQLNPDTSAVKWYWYFSDTLSGIDNTSNLQNPTHVFTAAGTYHVILTVRDYQNSNYSFIKEVIINPAPITDFTCSTQNCDSQTVYFKNACSTSEGFINAYVWDFGDGGRQWVLYPDNPDVSHTYSQPGSYNVTLSIAVAINPGTTDSCYSHKSKQVITPLLPAHFTFTKPALNEPVQFTDQSNPCSAILTGWLWDFGDGNYSTVQNPIYTYTIPGNYAVTLNINDSNGNSGTADSVLFVPVTGKSSILKGKMLVGTETINESTVKLVQIDASGIPVSNRTTSTGIDGNFTLENVPDGNYYLLAYPKINGPIATKFLPTYFTNSVYWPSATLINLGQAQDQYDIQLEPYTILNGGTLIINGQLLNSGKSLNPAKQEVLLLDNQNNPVRWTFSDLAGNYSFDSLPAGNYRVNPVMSGLTSYPSVVDLNENTSPAFVKMYISGQTITAKSAKEPADNLFKIYPNPAHDILNIDMNNSFVTYPAEIINTSGKILKTARLISGTNTIQISNLPTGLYLLKISGQIGSQYTQRFIKQ
jgi:PKD repeat protein